MNKRLLSGALGTLLLAGGCMHPSASATPVARVGPPAFAPQDGASVYKFTEGASSSPSLPVGRSTPIKTAPLRSHPRRAATPRSLSSLCPSPRT